MPARGPRPPERHAAKAARLAAALAARAASVAGAALVAAAALAGCGPKPVAIPIDYRGEMRRFVEGVSEYAKGIRPGFAVAPQNGLPLLLDGALPSAPYLAAIDAVAQEDLHYGYLDDDVATPADVTSGLEALMDLARGAGKAALAIDYCSSPAKIDDALSRSAAKGYLPFAADRRALDDLPPLPAPIFMASPASVPGLAAARNFLYLIDPSAFPSRQAFIDALRATDYDAIVVDLFFDDGASAPSALTAEDVAALKSKPGGGSRPVLCYLSIGEAESYRYYWRDSWLARPPAWLGAENPDWPGNYKVRYWDPAWQAIIFGGEASYARMILDAGFDGAYLDLVDAYEYWEGL